MNSKDNWTFSRFIEEIIHLSEISEVPGIEDARNALLREVWKRYPVECEALGLEDDGWA